MTCYSGANPCYKFQLIIDGCNGPIRFREDRLRKAVSGIISEEGNSVNSNEPCATNAASGNHPVVGDDDDDTILSLLRPDSIAVDPPRKQMSKHRKNKKGTKDRRKKNHNPKTENNTERADFVQDSLNRLDMIPLLQKLLLSSNDHVGDGSPERSQVFDSVLVLFDGVSITKRPPVPIGKRGSKTFDEKTMEEEIARGRCWHVKSDNSDTIVAMQASESTSSNDAKSESGSLAIEVTGLYEEADNVIVDLVQELYSRKNDRERYRATDASTSKAEGPSTAVTRIRVMRRTERGAGKNRRLFQSLGLLRPESVACVFDFVSPASSASDEHSDSPQDEFNNGDSFRDRQPKLDSAPFRRLALDGHQTLRSVRRQNPGNVFLVLDEPLEVPFDTGTEGEPTVILPIVVTDDIFLRQRIIHKGGYVMTFHQFWLLLNDVV